jgi:glycosyltransferase involved in cell wall biosynthesis
LKFGDLVSVVIPVYNRAHLLAHTVGSVCRQSYDNIEILIVDDCSTDEVEDAVASLCDSRVRLVRRTQNGGAGAARNTGLLEAKGELIAFFDSDDICVVDRIERQVRFLASQDDDYIGVYSARLFYNDVDEGNYVRSACHIRPYPDETPLSGEIYRRTTRGNIINLPTFMALRSEILAAGAFDELLRSNEDWDLCIRLTQRGKIGFEPMPLVLTPTALKPDIIAQRVSRSALHTTRSFVRITGKLRKAGVDPSVLAVHHANAGLSLLLRGRSGLARMYFRKSLSEKPFAPRIWAHYLFSFMPRLHAGIRTLRRHAS